MGISNNPFFSIKASKYCKKQQINPIEYLLFDFTHQSKEGRENYLSDYLTSETAWSTSDKAFFDKKVKDKYAFYCLHEKFFVRKAMKVNCKDNYESFKQFCQGKTVFVKPLDKSMGKGAFVYINEPNTEKPIFNEMLSEGENWIVEEIINQHPIMAEWNNSSLNTVRVPTILCDDGTFHVIGTFMRTGRKGSVVDNGAAGGIITAIDSINGVAVTDGVNEKGQKFVQHPDSGKVYKKFHLPEWDKCLAIVEEAHRTILPNIKYIAYDMAYSENGWVMVEANCGQFLGQYATKQGLKIEFLKYMNK